MGSIISAQCDCGYKVEEMFLGGGMMNFTKKCTFPHYCEKCKIIFLGNLFEKEILCPECGKGEVIAYDDERACKSEGGSVFSWNIGGEVDRELKLSDGKYFCPACGAFRLTFSDIGCWD